jgi:benzoyl-CoA reductase/2-hydroxyglutaryl-CoA dehydratase subunit BcrC/BadD/HgdB
MMSKSLKEDLMEVRHTISDVKDTMETLEFEQTSQRILLINSGWNWETLWGMLTCVMERLLREIADGSPNEHQPPISFSVAAIQQVVDYWSTYPELVDIFEAAHNLDVKRMESLLQIAKHRLHVEACATE